MLIPLVLLSIGAIFAGFAFKELFIGYGEGNNFWKDSIKPGRPFGFGVLGKTPVLILPGNPICGNAMSMNEDTLIWKFGLDSLLGSGFNIHAESVITSKDKLQKTTVIIIFFLLIVSIILIKKQSQ